MKTKIILGSLLLASGLAARAQLTWVGGDATQPLDWSLVNSNWDDGANTVVWTQGGDAVFDTAPGGNVRLRGGATGTGGPIEVNSVTVNFGGTLTLTRASGNDVDELYTVGQGLFTIDAGNILSAQRISGTAGLTLDGGGEIRSSRGFNYTGGTTILHGTLRPESAGLPTGTGTLTLLDTSGSGDATLRNRGVNSNFDFGSNIVVQSGSTGKAILMPDPTTGTAAYTHTFSGDISMGNTLQVTADANGLAGVALSGDMSGSGLLELGGNAFVQKTFTLSGDNSAHSGSISFYTTNNNNPHELVINGTQGNSNINLQANDLSGTGTLTYNIFSDTSDLITKTANSDIDLSGFTLDINTTGIQSFLEYVLINSNTGVTGTFANVTGGYTIDYDGTDLNPDAVVVVIPEPSTLMLMAIGLLLPLYALRRRK
ncbi:MAG: PEP-CTERM sorting domain-containing protein [Kiritimatiellia bacterium]